MFDPERCRTDVKWNITSVPFGLFSTLDLFSKKNERAVTQWSKNQFSLLHLPSCFSASERKTVERRWEQIILCYRYWQEETRRRGVENKDIREDEEMLGGSSVPALWQSQQAQTEHSELGWWILGHLPPYSSLPPTVKVPVASGWRIRECEKRI